MADAYATEYGLYWHGGPARLKLILPPSRTGVACTSDYTFDQAIHRRDRVYLTTEHEMAHVYACFQRAGAVYLVEPVGPLETDADCLIAGKSYCCQAANILWRYGVPASEAQEIRRRFIREHTAEEIAAFGKPLQNPLQNNRKSV